MAAYRRSGPHCGPLGVWLIKACQSDCAGDLAGTQAPRAGVHMARSAIDDGLYALNIRLPCAVGTAMGMRDLNAESHALTAVITLCHWLHLLAVKKINRFAKRAVMYYMR